MNPLRRKPIATPQTCSLHRRQISSSLLDTPQHHHCSNISTPESVLLKLHRISTTTRPPSQNMAAATTQQPQQKKNITIIGGGIIGCTTAYYLTRHPSYSPQNHRITLLEAASSSSVGGRTIDSLQDPAELAYPVTSPPLSSNDDEVIVSTPSQALRKEHDGIAGGASGKAGGLLALWAFPSNIVPLSFRLHQELAEEHGGKTRWGYRRCWASQVECEARVPVASSSLAITGNSTGNGGTAGGVEGGGDVGGKKDNSDGNTKGLHKDHKKSTVALKRIGAPEELDWVLEDGFKAYENIGTPENTAQVHPELFTRSMAALAEEAGVRIVTGARVTGITYANGENAKGSAREEVESVTYIQRRRGEDGNGDGEEQREVTLETTDCVVAAGPWTERLLPGIPVTASRAHSVVIQTPRAISAFALFTAIGLPKGFPSPSTEGSGSCKSSGGRAEGKEVLKRPTTVEPEIYARPDGTAYACGPTDAVVPLPLTTEGVEVDETRCVDILTQVGAISGELDTSSKDGGKVLAKQACYLPQGGPWIGQVPGKKGVVVAAGHTCWGIQNAPGTGKLVSEIVLEGRARSAKLGGCDPTTVM